MKRLVACLFFTLLAACQEAPKAYTPTDFNFSKSTPLSVNVAEIKVIESYQAPIQRPNVEHEFPTPPAVALKQWANQRLRATGSQGVLEVSIDDASVREVLLPKTKGFKGLITNDQDARYDANIRVSMRLYNGTDPISVASGDVIVTRSKSIDEKATVEDHERLYDGMTRDMLNAFDMQATQRLRQYFSAYLR